MKTSLFRIKTKDNLILQAVLYEPDFESKKILIHVHGSAGNFYENYFLDFLANTLTKNGIAFLTFNNRGCELMKDMFRVASNKKTIVRIGNAYEKFEDCLIDIAAAIDFVAKKGFIDIYLSGHSFGGPKTAYYMTKTKDKRIKTLIFLSPADMIGLAKADKDRCVDLKMAKDMIFTGKGNEIMTKIIQGEGYMSADSYMSVYGESSDVAIFNLYDSNDKLKTLSSISVPTLIVMGRKDIALTVPVDELMKRVKSALVSSPKAEGIILGDSDHGYNGYEQQLADTINEWLNNLK